VRLTTRIKRPNNVYPNINRIEYPNNRPNENEIFGEYSGNSFGSHSDNKNVFGHNLGKALGQYSGSEINSVIIRVV
jgi:hypothetical protein